MMYSIPSIQQVGLPSNQADQTERVLTRYTGDYVDLGLTSGLEILVGVICTCLPGIVSPETVIMNSIATGVSYRRTDFIYSRSVSSLYVLHRDGQVTQCLSSSIMTTCRPIA